MTAVLGVSFGVYALIVADTRVSRTQPDGSVLREDGELKIGRTRNGLICGAGSGGLVQAIRQHIDETNAPIGSCLSAADYVRADFERHFAEEQNVLASIRSTEFVCTYFGPAVDHDLVMPTGRPLRDSQSERVRVVASVREPAGYAFMAIESGLPWILGDVPLDAWRRELIDLFLANRAPRQETDDPAAIREHIDRNIRAAATVISSIAERHESVSRTVQVGVHLAPGALGLSGVSDGNPPVALDFP